MIDHTTRMLAVDLQGLIASYDGQAILPKMNEIIVRLGGNAMPDSWPSTLHLTYFVACLMQHIPAGITSLGDMKIGQAGSLSLVSTPFERTTPLSTAEIAEALKPPKADE